MDTKGLHFLIGAADWGPGKTRGGLDFGITASNRDNGTPVHCSFD